jgi:hypothetical protein
MRTLNRPMFNMGGPIKQGVMHGIREPKRDGGSMRETQQWNTVGSPAFPKDSSGRARHVLPAAGAIMAGLANLYRGYKAARYIAPHAATMGQKIKSAILPTSRFMQMGPSKMFRAGAFAKQNPMLAFTAASSVPQAGYAGYKVAKAAPGTVWEGTKRWADYVIPGDQSRWWKDKEPPTGIPLNPNLQKKVAAAAELSNEKKNEFAKAEREDRVQKYLDMMGYDRSKKTAIADALIDASKIVSERGSLDPKNITQELINPIIQATSKRLDKPDQIREAVGLMATKAEIEKDLEDPQVKKLRELQIEKGELDLEQGFEVDMRNLFTQSRTAPDRKTVERYARYTADKHGHDFTKITAEELKNASGETEEEKIQNVVGDDGVYLIGDAIIKVTGGVPKLFG